MHFRLLILAALGTAAAGLTYAYFDTRETSLPETAVVEETMITEVPETAVITFEPGLDREAVTKRIGDALGFDANTVSQLHDTYRVMQWDAFNEVLVPHLIEKYHLTEEDREILLTHATVFLDRDRDILETLYTEGPYQFSTDDSVVEIATKLITPLEDTKATLIPGLVDPDAERELLAYVRNETELLPDLVPLPPLDVDLREENGRVLLIFSTIYYNQGLGNLELRADPNTIGVIGDFDRNVYQRIYRPNDTYRERTAGTFEWHQEHLHYHFIDFIEYRLTAEDGTPEIESTDIAQKSTFCIRDVSRVYIDGVPSSTPASYRICGRERQGVSVGWGDAYFNTYVDQNLDITDLPSGEYTLRFHANPANRFDEADYANNTASARLRYSKEEGTVEVLETTPRDLPHFEHIHIEQDL